MTDNIDEELLLWILLRRRKKKQQNKRKRRQPRFWVRDIFLKREELGEYHQLIQELQAGDREYYFRYFRMSPERFQHLLSMVNPLISKQNTNFRKCIPSAERLAVTLRFLATGDSQQSLSFSFRLGKTTVSNIINETCEAIYQCLKGEYLNPPQTAEEWQNISKQFNESWNMPNVIGAIDGKHIRIECPKLTGTQYYNYKGFFSIVLLAICDANYNFTLFDLGQFGSNNDSGVLSSSALGKMFDSDSLNLPPPSRLAETDDYSLPYFLLGDEIFPLKCWLMRPYPGQNANEEERIYNYRHSRGRRVIENAFGILSARWRIFQKPIRATVENVQKYTLACLTLHNYLRQTDNAFYSPSGFVDSEDSSGEIVQGSWRSISSEEDIGALRAIRPVRGSRPRSDAIQLREHLKGYVNSAVGSVPWQWDYIRRTSAKY